MKNKSLIVLFSTLFSLGLFLQACRQNPYRQGEILYLNFCANCHMEDGRGLAALYPPLAGSDYLTQKDGRLACLIRYGMEGPIEVNGTVYDMEMPGVEQLSPVEITNVINYIHHAWGNELRTIQLEEVRADLKDCPPQRELLGE